MVSRKKRRQLWKESKREVAYNAPSNISNRAFWMTVKRVYKKKKRRY